MSCSVVHGPKTYFGIFLTLYLHSLSFSNQTSTLAVEWCVSVQSKIQPNEGTSFAFHPPSRVPHIWRIYDKDYWSYSGGLCNKTLLTPCKLAFPFICHLSTAYIPMEFAVDIDNHWRINPNVSTLIFPIATPFVYNKCQFHHQMIMKSAQHIYAPSRMNTLHCGHSTSLLLALLSGRAIKFAHKIFYMLVPGKSMSLQVWRNLD